jgi:hypothetical protein
MFCPPDQTRRRFGRAAAVVGDGRDVGDRAHLEAGGLERPDRLLATGTRSLDVDLDLAHAVLHRPARGAVGGEGGAYGVLLREPLNPATPAEPQLITAPLRSVIVMMVLLNVAWM